VRALDRAAQRGIVHRNAAARRKSRLMSRLHQLSIAPVEVVEVAPTPETKARTAAKSPARRATTTKAAGAKPAAARKPAAPKPAPRAQA